MLTQRSDRLETHILGTTYAVILGFLLYAVWAIFEQAELNVDLEANAVVDFYRLADALPEPQRTQLQTSRVAPDGKGKVPEIGSTINAEMWKTVISVKSAQPIETSAQEQSMSELGRYSTA